MNEMLQSRLADRALPELMTLTNNQVVISPEDWRIRRKELLELLSREEYGYTPAAPESVTASIDPNGSDPYFFAGKATQEKVLLSFDTPGGTFTFPFMLAIPRAVRPAPAFVYLSFRPDFPDRYLPVEEILDHGFAVASICYQDVTADSADWNGLAALYPRDEKTGWGKIGMWAFAASRVMDYLLTRPEIDARRICVSGHSRLGKTALWCAAQDERFAMAVSNDSGCSGAALSRGKNGETIEHITDRFPYWFCGNYCHWRMREHEAPFDQHMLLALIAPRRLYVSSASEDDWADPVSEFLSCVAASSAWTLHQKPGLLTPDAMPQVDQPLMEGTICYHVRTGTHFHSRTDWLHHMQCREKHHI